MFLPTFIFLVLVDISTGTCVELRFINLMDCSDASMSSIDGLSARKWVKVVNFRRNDFVTLNMTRLLWLYPNVREVDLRDNPRLDCEKIRESTHVRVETDCKFQLPTRSVSSCERSSSILVGFMVSPSLTLDTIALKPTSSSPKNSPSTFVRVITSTLQRRTPSTNTSTALVAVVLSTGHASVRSSIEMSYTLKPDSSIVFSTIEGMQVKSASHPFFNGSVTSDSTSVPPLQILKGPHLTLIISIGSTAGALLVLLCFWATYRQILKWKARQQQRRIAQHQQSPSQIELLSLGALEGHETSAKSLSTEL